jgi:signal recognition particle GTPase
MTLAGWLLVLLLMTVAYAIYQRVQRTDAEAACDHQSNNNDRLWEMLVKERSATAGLREERDKLDLELKNKILELRQAEQLIDKLSAQTQKFVQGGIDGQETYNQMSAELSKQKRKLAQADVDLRTAQYMIEQLNAQVARRDKQLQNALNMHMGYTYRVDQSENMTCPADSQIGG